MKKHILVSLFFGCIFIVGLVGCKNSGLNADLPLSNGKADSSKLKENSLYPDGIYRGYYYDNNIQAMGIQFSMKDGKFAKFKFRSLQHKNKNCLTDQGSKYYGVKSQYEQAVAYLLGKSPEAVNDLLHPKKIIQDTDALTGATLRVGVLTSAIRDGLSRGVYKPDDIDSLIIRDPQPDGIYRGYFYDSGIQQVAIQFTLKNNRFAKIKYRGLAYKNGNYLSENANSTQKQILAQFAQLADYLKDKPLSFINELYMPGKLLQDMDSVSGATLRSNKVISAIHDALNRGVYKPIDTTRLVPLDVYENGTYRGYFYDGGFQQVAIQFDLLDNRFKKLKFRGLAYKDGNYLGKNPTTHQAHVRAQFEQALSYLKDKPVSALYDLYNLEGTVSDIDGLSGATLRSGKLISALKDALNRGVYRLPCY